MNKAHITLNFEPNESEVNEILSWTSLNKSEIWDCFISGKIIVAKKNEEIISFIAYKLRTVTIYISIAETKENYRRQRIMNLLLNELKDKYSNSKYLAFYLFCSPKESQFAWKKYGFSYYPENALHESEKLFMFRIFGEVCEINLYENFKLENDFIEIWDKENPKEIENPKWVAKLEINIDTKKLEKPFLFFANNNWKIRIKHNNLTKECRYKKYDIENEIFECMFIEKLK